MDETENARRPTMGGRVSKGQRKKQSDPWLDILNTLETYRLQPILHLYTDTREDIQWLPKRQTQVVRKWDKEMFQQAMTFIGVLKNCQLKQQPKKRFFAAYERRMHDTVTHPLFQYKINYRRTLDLEVRLLARFLEGGRKVTKRHFFIVKDGKQYKYE